LFRRFALEKLFLKLFIASNPFNETFSSSRSLIFGQRLLINLLEHSDS
jgi:hypothetical protein